MSRNHTRPRWVQISMRGAFAVIVVLGACERVEPSEPPPIVVLVSTEPEPGVSVTPRIASPIAINPREVAPSPPIVPQKKTWFTSLTGDQRKDVREFCTLKVSDPCEGMLRREPSETGVRMAALIEDFDADEQTRVRKFCASNYRGTVCNTPLVLAFEPGAIALVASTATFSFTPGTPSRSDWPTPRAPWLALDRDGDGAITSGAELFGDSTRLADGSTALHGFAALADLDANRDGVIDARDATFASLLLWADTNADHASSADELRPARDVLISIALAYDTEARCDQRGNCEGQRSAMTWRDATGTTRSGEVVDIYLRQR